jgi:single-strand DNA-binding protein
LLNRVVLIGRLTKDPELRYTPNGVAVTNFTLAVERNFKNAQGEKETDFFSCSVFKQLAELCANYLAKGKMASIDGRVQIRTYNDKDGQKHWVTEIIGDNVQFLSPKGEDNSQDNNNSTYQRTLDEVSTDGDDDVPF